MIAYFQATTGTVLAVGISIGLLAWVVLLIVRKNFTWRLLITRLTAHLLLLLPMAVLFSLSGFGPDFSVSLLTEFEATTVVDGSMSGEAQVEQSTNANLNPANSQRQGAFRPTTKALSTWNLDLFWLSIALNILGVIWLVGAALQCVGIVRGIVQTHHLIQNSRIPDRVERGRIRSLGCEAIQDVSALILISDQVSTPLVAGILTPRIILPSTMLGSFGFKELTFIIQHEASHLANHDQWFVLESRVLKMIYWWNPFARSINRIHSQLREVLCDLDTAIESESIAYAETLLKLANAANESRVSTKFALGNGILGGESSLEHRIRLILSGDPRRIKATAPWRTTTVVLILSVALIAPVSASTKLLIRNHSQSRILNHASEVNSSLEETQSHVSHQRDGSDKLLTRKAVSDEFVDFEFNSKPVLRIETLDASQLKTEVKTDGILITKGEHDEIWIEIDNLSSCTGESAIDLGSTFEYSNRNPSRFYIRLQAKAASATDVSELSIGHIQHRLTDGSLIKLHFGLGVEKNSSSFSVSNWNL